jgi:glycosyltransferase involved in cell wall biosynthesis
MLRVKDGMPFVHEWLDCFERLADEIVVLDNGSTDGTDEVLLAHPKVVDLVRTEGYNEGRDKNLLHAHVRMRNPDWCLWVDIDEIFEPDLTRAHFDRLMQRSYVNKYAFRRFHFIDREYFAGSLFRLNYSAGHDRVMWREHPQAYFQDLLIDSPNVKGVPGWKAYTNFRLKHLGYISKELVDRKADLYRTIIPDRESTFQEMYLRNEKKIRWHDNRNSAQVLLLNGLLNCMQARQLGIKAFNRAAQALRSRYAQVFGKRSLS